MANNPYGHVGLFDKRGTGFKIHKGDCGMLRTGTGKAKRYVAVRADDDEVDDLLERVYTVSYCKCVPKGQRRALTIGARTAEAS